jgi:Uma2 family endonuclease
MAVQIKRRMLTLEEYERTIEAGVFNEDERIELIEGEIVEMAPIGFPHEMCVARLTKLLERVAGDGALVWPQNNSIRLAATRGLNPTSPCSGCATTNGPSLQLRKMCW